MFPRTTSVTQRICAILGLAASAVLPAADAAQFGDVSVFAQVPVSGLMTGYPEGIAVRGNRVYVSGPATFGTSLSDDPSPIFEFDRNTGALLRTLTVKGEQLLGSEHANSCVAFDGNGHLHVLNTQLGTLRINLQSEAQTTYAPPLPDHPACLLGLNKQPCTPTLADQPPLPNDLVFDDAGNLYVTDSMQATIWRIPPGGGTPQVWFRDSRLAAVYIGVNGIRLSPDRGRVFLSVTTDMLGLGRIYTLPLVDKPKASDLKLFHTFAVGDGPDGFAFGVSGNLYVTLALPGKSGIAVLDPGGNEIARIANPPLSPLSPFDSPANVAFDGKGNLLVTNHAFATGVLLPDQFQVLRVYVNDLASPLATPLLP
jgi:sugar lactone lactonase YvrE